MKKKILNVLIITMCIMCMSIISFAATSVTFKVNRATVTGSISYKNASEYNPFEKDSVTATTTSSASMDVIETSATIYYTEGSSVKTNTTTNRVENDTECKVTAYASLMGVGYKGTGTHYAYHSGYSNSGSTSVTW